MIRNIKKSYPNVFIDWHPVLNGKVNINSIEVGSRKKYWWRCHNKKCGCNWKATIYARINLGDKCPKCTERKKEKFVSDLVEIKRIFKEIRLLQSDVDKNLDVFINDDSNKISKKRSSVNVRRKIDKINLYGLQLRKMIMTYKRKILSYKKIKKDKK
jgi:hypothetical protein